MASLKRKHDTEAAPTEDQASKRQRIQNGSQFYAAEPETIENDVTMPDALRSPVLPPARRRRKASTSDPNNHQVTYLVGRKKPGQPKSRQAVVNLHGRRKDVEQCIAFLEKYSPSDNNNLIARLTQSPTMSVVNALEIRSWSTDVKTPEYCADLELWQRREEHYSPPLPAVSPYPRPVSLVLRYPDRHVALAKPARVLRVDDFDELQEGLLSLSDVIFASLRCQPNLTQFEMESPSAGRALAYATAQIWAATSLEQHQVSNHDLNPLIGTLLQNFDSLSQFSVLDALISLFDLFAIDYQDAYSPLVDIILHNIAQSCQHQVLASIARSGLRWRQSMPQKLTRYVQRTTDILSQKLPVDDGILIEHRAQLAVMHGLSNERNSGLSVIRDMCEMVETSAGSMQDFTLYCCLANIARAYLDLQEYEEAIKYYMFCVGRQRALGRCCSPDVALFWRDICFCYDRLSLLEKAYQAAVETVEVALRSPEPFSPLKLQYFMVQQNTAWTKLVAHRKQKSKEFEKSLWK